MTKAYIKTLFTILLLASLFQGRAAAQSNPVYYAPNGLRMPTRATVALPPAGNATFFWNGTTWRYRKPDGSYTDLGGGGGGGISGLTPGRLAKAGSSSTIVDSILSESSNVITLNGASGSNPVFKVTSPDVNVGTLLQLDAPGGHSYQLTAAGTSIGGGFGGNFYLYDSTRGGLVFLVSSSNGDIAFSGTGTFPGLIAAADGNQLGGTGSNRFNIIAYGINSSGSPTAGEIHWGTTTAMTKIAPSFLQLGSGVALQWSAGDPTGVAADVDIKRGAANTLFFGNGSTYDASATIGDGTHRLANVFTQALQGGYTKTLTHATATSFMDLNVASNTSVGVELRYTLTVTNASNHQQVEQGSLYVSAINEAGTVAGSTGAVGVPLQTLHTATTLTNTFTITTGANKITVKANATSTLSGTPVYTLTWTVVSPGTPTFAAV